jgi:hypothetical protein
MKTRDSGWNRIGNALAHVALFNQPETNEPNLAVTLSPKGPADLVPPGDVQVTLTDREGRDVRVRIKTPDDYVIINNTYLILYYVEAKSIEDLDRVEVAIGPDKTHFSLGSAGGD